MGLALIGRLLNQQTGLFCKLATFEAPPNLERAVAKWALSRYAAHILAVSERAIEDLNAKLVEAAQLQETKGTKEYKHGLKTDIVEWFNIQSSAKRYASEPRLYSGVTRTQITVDISGWKYMGAGSHVIINEVNDAIRTINLRNSESIKISRSKGDSHAPILVESSPGLLSVEDMPIEAAKKYRLPSLKPNQIQEALNAIRFGKITCILNFRPDKEAGATWSFIQKTLRIYVPEHDFGAGFTADDFDNAVETIKDRVRHEVQHVGQDLLSAIRGLKHRAGGPKRGLKQNLEPGSISEHALRDVEFQTVLEDNISKVKRILPTIHRDRRREYVRMWVDQDPFRRGSRAFRAWKEHAPEKWRRAVSELVKEVQQYLD